MKLCRLCYSPNGHFWEGQTNEQCNLVNKGHPNTYTHIHTRMFPLSYACAHSHDSRDEHTQENLERKNNVPFRNVFAHNSYTSIHSFTQAISIAPLQVHYYSEALPTQHGCSVEVSRRSTTGNRQSKYR